MSAICYYILMGKSSDRVTSEHLTPKLIYASLNYRKYKFVLKYKIK